MRKEEINEVIVHHFKKINKYFHKVMDGFEMGKIIKFRTEIKKLKAFLHLVNMESEDGLSFHISKRMKTLYGYLGIIQNFEQLKKTNEYTKDYPQNDPFCFVVMIEKKLDYWKKLSKEFVAEDYDFIDDKEKILAMMPDKLTKKSIKKFIHYTLYELNTINGRLDDVALDNTRKFIEDIYFNYEYIKPYITDQQINLFDKEELVEFLRLFNDYRDKCMAIALLQTLSTTMFNKEGQNILQEIENDWLHKKQEIKNLISDKFKGTHVTVNTLNEFDYADS